MKKSIIIIIQLLCFLNAIKTNAYNLKQISNIDGLSNSAILSMCQDKDGMMWIGSADGLNTYDSKNIYLYNPNNKRNALSGNLIENILQTSDGTLWIHTNYGLNCLNKETKSVKRFNQFRGLFLMQSYKDNCVFIIKEDNYIYYFDIRTGTIKKIMVRGLKYKEILDFSISTKDILHLFTKEGEDISFRILNTKNADKKLIPLKTERYESNPIYCSHEKDRNDTEYIIDNKYNFIENNLLNGEKTYITNLSKYLKDKGDISSIIKYNKDFFIGLKTEGLLHIKSTNNVSRNYEIENFGINTGVFCLLKDKFQDLIWIGTDGQGVYMYYNDSFSIKSFVFDSWNLHIEKPVRAIFMDQYKNLWIGTKGDGILEIRNFKNTSNNGNIENIRRLQTDNSDLYDNSVYSITPSIHNILWIGTDNGINYYSFKYNKLKKIDLSAGGKKIKYIHDICEFNDSTLWIASVGMGLIKASIKWKNGEPILFSEKRIYFNKGIDYYNYFFSSFKENDQYIWFGNRGYGAYRINNDNLKTENIQIKGNDYKQTINDIFSLCKDLEGNIWLGTSDGLVKHDTNGKNTLFNSNNGFPNNTIHGIILDNDNNLWFSTNKGVIKFNTKTNRFQIYNELNGLQVIEFSDGAASYDKGSQTMFFGGINGFISILRSGIHPKPFTPKIQFENITLFGKTENIKDFIRYENKKDVLHLKYNQNFFSLDFIAVDFIDGNDYIYYYKLGDKGDKWIENGNSNKISFTKLNPGTYTLSVRYVNRNTGRESSVYTMGIKISPPWYLSTLAISLYILASLAIAYYAIKIALIRNKKKRERQQEKIRIKHQEEVYESKLSFFTNIAHEFCTPLTLIYGPCSRILSYKGADFYIKKYVSLIQRNAERLNGLIQDLIEFRSMETGDKTPQYESLNISEISNDVYTDFREMAESRGITFIRHIQANILWNSDKNFYYTILTNLLSNAFKYTDPNGTVCLKVFIKDNYLLVSVSNTGKGIRQQDLNRIFDRYTILDNLENRINKNKTIRNGLGLAICSSMVNLLEGKINVSSILYEETEFTVRLPQKDPNEGPSPKRQLMNIPEHEKNINRYYKPLPVFNDTHEYDPSKPTVMVIDDDNEILWLIKDSLQEDYNVITVDSSLNMGKILEKDDPDVILCDIMMDGIDGISLTKKIKENNHTAHIPIILISAKHSTEDQIEGLDSGADMYITKPFSIEFLKTALKQIISRKEILKDYYHSPKSAYDMIDGKMTHNDDQKFLKKIYKIIEDHIEDSDLSVNFIAEKLNMTSRHLYRKLKEIGDFTLADIIKNNRLHYAKSLLINTQLTIEEIIYKSGFKNRATFFRSFLNKFECTPKEFREKNSIDK